MISANNFVFKNQSVNLLNIIMAINISLINIMSIEIVHNKKKILRDFVSGLTAGVISTTLCNPLDITRTRLNLMSSSTHEKIYRGFIHGLRTIWRQEGMKGLFAGYKVNVVAIPIFHSIFFPLYEYSKELCKKQKLNKWQLYIASSVIAGSACNIITNPLWVIRTRVMSQALHPEHLQYENSNIFKIMSRMITEEGVSSLLKGVTASVLGVSNAVVYFFFYESLKDQLFSHHKGFGSKQVFFVSIFSKLIASMTTYPLIVTRTIMQDHRTAGDKQLVKMSEVFKDIYKNQGMKGFYAGLIPDLLRLLPANTIVFLVYEFMKMHIKVDEDDRV